jgi:hypothetical protein
MYAGGMELLSAYFKYHSSLFGGSMNQSNTPMNIFGVIPAEERPVKKMKV